MRVRTRGARATAARAAVLLGGAALVASLAATAASFPYRVLQRVPVDGAAPVSAVGFSPGGKRVYAAVGDELRSYDTASGRAEPAVKLPGTGVGLAAAAPDGPLYVVTRSPARLLLLTPHPLRLRTSVALHGGEPSGLLFDRQSNSLFVESRAAGSIARLDPRTGKMLAIAHLHGRLAQMASNGRGALYVADTTADELTVLATGGMTRTGAIPLTGCSAPDGLAMDQVGRRLFVACANGQALVVDEDMGFTFVRLSIERAAHLRLAFALKPLGPDGWKGGAFMAGDGPGLDAIRMNAFISYVGGGSLPLGGRCTALAVSAAARRLVLAVAPRDSGAGSGQAATAGTAAVHTAAGVELIILGGVGSGVAR
jgi:hypothetical protein